MTLNQVNGNGPFLIVDGSSVLVRAYFANAYSGRLMQSRKGVYTNAVFGFLNMMFRLIEQVNPSHLFVAWDVSRDTFRRELYPAYKGTRGELPDALHPQFTTMQDVLEAIGVTQHRDERYEADDIIGTLSRQAANEGHRVMILTGDRDALQLVNDKVTVAIMKKGITEMDLYTPEFLLEQWGLSAHQIIDLKGLMGDTSDNIPGVPGIGEKTAKKLLDEFHSIENLFANIDHVKGKVKEKLMEHKELAFLSKQLATIYLEVPLTHEMDAYKLSFQEDRAKQIFEELDLHRTQTLFDRIIQVS